MPACPLRKCARLAWRSDDMDASNPRNPVPVAFDQPVLLVRAPEAAHRLSQLLEHVEALDPKQLLLERLGRFLDAARYLAARSGRGAMPRSRPPPGSGRIESRRSSRRSAGRARRRPPLDKAEVSAQTSHQIGGGEAVHPAGGVVLDPVRGVVNDHEHRAPALAARPGPRWRRSPAPVRDVAGDRARAQPGGAPAYLVRIPCWRA